MVSALVTLLLPAAQALSINGYFKAPVAIDSLAGTYTAVECKAAPSGTAEVAYSNGTLRISSGDAVLAEFSDAQSDGYGHFTKFVNHPRTTSYTTTTANLIGKNLTITVKTQSAFSRGYGAITETCVLTR
jgi:lipopolysaccharide export system protein LptA